MSPAPLPLITAAVPSRLGVYPDAKAAGSYYTDPLDRRQHRRLQMLLQCGVLGSSATVDAKLQESGLATELFNELDGSQDTGLGLRIGTDDNVELAQQFTTPNNGGVTVTQIKAKFKAVGTLASGKVVTATIQAVSAGVPDDTDLFTPVAGDLAPDEISTSEYVTVTFTLPAGVVLAANTAYAVVFEGDYTLSASNYLLLGIDTVASGGLVNIHDADWAAVVTTQTALIDVIGHDWTDVSGAAFSQKTQAGGDGSQAYIGEVNLKPRQPVVRGVLTVGTATSDVGMQMLLLDPIRTGNVSALDFQV